jgi:N-acyl-D-amino-acid deacylase
VKWRWVLCALILFAANTSADAAPEIILRGGVVYDGTGTPGRQADVAISGDRILSIGKIAAGRSTKIIDARGMAVAPGFINMLSWSTESLLIDGRSQSDIRQGVTLELLGEGTTMGPLSPEMKAEVQARLHKLGVENADWNTLGEYLALLERRGVSTNVASFIGATTVRLNVLGPEGRAASDDEVARMASLVTGAMREGAFGISSALEYTPGDSADTAELIALARAAAPFGGLYISHIRNEDEHLVDAVGEVIDIARSAGVPAEIYHFKVKSAHGLNRLDRAIDLIETARREGLAITADVYPYTASATGFDVAMPSWVQDGGVEKWVERLKDPAIRQQVAAEMRHPKGGGTGRLEAAGSLDNILILGGETPEVKALSGMTLGQIARARGTSPEDTVMDMVIADQSRLYVAYFIIPEEGVRRVIARPWVSVGSDAASMTAEGAILKQREHPRAYGAFARILGHYTREEPILSLAEAVHKMSGLPAANLGLTDRGLIRPGYFADIVVFDPKRIADQSTFEHPHQYTTGVRDVFVNGVAVLAKGQHTGAMPGRAVLKRQPGGPDMKSAPARP